MDVHDYLQSSVCVLHPYYSKRNVLLSWEQCPDSVLFLQSSIAGRTRSIISHTEQKLSEETNRFLCAQVVTMLAYTVEEEKKSKGLEKGIKITKRS